ncbi:alpha/beta-hydrolase [Sodiomyces alkalinus F11]|uniref:Alpha/beta-hydrolase n=1 Tax=Sodiomyces alkalinus (strain CBS 110278 / VKM F-3762 / F11) TaxID=1314773 RepID=A0A3N2PND4_SODAK|nr:alpha/beta-hydrolase [Sodiomyces alkalinus F11]ROT35944.1 alpha/beta-hydrolase [Sodiomyces alkalinus F11]
MILTPVSLLDSAIFCLFLAPQLIIHVGLFRTIYVALSCLPFLLVRLPLALIRDRLLRPRSRRPPFVARASFFEDLVVRCVRYAFRNVPAHVGRVFFHKAVAMPFLAWRMARHGYFTFPTKWAEYKEEGPEGFSGVWISADPSKPPDMVLYYVHGGGFAMGSVHFYLEILLAWHSLLAESGYQNPCIFALEYSLVPERTFPTQVQETMRGYRHVLSVAGDPGKVVVSGDSAGGTLVLSLLLEIGRQNDCARAYRRKVEWAATPGNSDGMYDRELKKHWLSVSETPLPALAILVSPWVTLVSSKHNNSTSDYLDCGPLHDYAMQYTGKDRLPSCAASPGLQTEHEVWAEASPSHGFFVTYGSEEVFAPDIQDFVALLSRATEVHSHCDEGGVHAWPVASLFLSGTENRLSGLKTLTAAIRKHVH